VIVMTTSNNFYPCPVCGEALNREPRMLQRKIASRYDCKRCGTFEASASSLADEYFDNTKHLVSAWIRRQNRMGINYPIVGVNTENAMVNWYLNLINLGLPTTPIEKTDALLKAYADLIIQQFNNKYDTVIKTQLYPFLTAEAVAKNMDEIPGLNRILSQLDYIDTEHDDLNVQIKAKGWFRVDELKKTTDVTDNAFIAMWFGSCTEKYRESAIAAVKHCGYKPFVVDQHEFNGFIMDQVVSLIRKSRFLIADFTCRPEIVAGVQKVQQGVRGGVYWEAGLAFGMGKPVIQTCENNEEAKRRLHFDLEQYNTIYWEDDKLTTDIGDMDSTICDPNFTEKLVSRILFTVGKGSYIPQK